MESLRLFVQGELRFPRINAARSMRRPVSGQSMFTRSKIERWGSKRPVEEREMRFKRVPPFAAAMSRHTEVMDWTAWHTRTRSSVDPIGEWRIALLSMVQEARHDTNDG